MVKIKKRHLEYIYLYTCLAIITAGLILVGFWSFCSYNVIEIKNVSLDKTIYRAGEKIAYTLTYCKYRELKAEVERTLINGTKLTFTPKMSNLPVGCHTTTIDDLIIPDYADPDIYHIEGTMTYQVNPIRKEEVVWKSDQFKIK